MKNVIIVLLTIICLLLALKISTINRYDINRDGKVSTLDYSMLKAYLKEIKNEK